MTEPTDRPEDPPPVVPPVPGGVAYPPAPNPYAYPYPYPYPPTGYPGPGFSPRNGLGLAALLCGIVGLVTSFTVVGGVVLGIIAVVCGFLGRGRVSRGEADNGGVALTGVILGIAAIVAGLIFTAVWIVFWGNVWKDVGGSDYMDCLQRAGSDQGARQQCADEFNEHLEDRFGVTVTPSATPYP